MKKLQSYADATNSIQYTYNADGIRTKKTVNGVTTTYHLVGDQVTMEQTGTNTPIYYAYDGSGNLFLVQYNGQNYFYARNTQNDIIGLVDSSGNWVVEYTYDAWGKLLSTTGSLAATLGVANPYRYRGYRYDNETGLYYLQSRYYDPTICRMLNADAVLDNRGVNTQNLFQYCGNNPVMKADPSGNVFGLIVVGVIAVGLIVALSACLAKSTPSTPTPAPIKPPSPTPGSSSSASLTQEQKHFVSVIAGEAIGANTKTQKAVAHTIMNRVKEPRDAWSKATTVTEVLVKAQYSAVNGSQYNKCMMYLNNRNGNNADYENLIAAVIPIYSGVEADFTGGAHYIFNVDGSESLLKALESQPNRYTKCGPFDGINDTQYRMYRCLW